MKYNRIGAIQESHRVGVCTGCHGPFAPPQELAEIAHRLEAEVDERAVHLTLGGLRRDEVLDDLELLTHGFRSVGRRQGPQAEWPLHTPMFRRQTKQCRRREACRLTSSGLSVPRPPIPLSAGPRARAVSCCSLERRLPPRPGVQTTQ